MYLAGIEFRPVVGFEDYYEVSADGAIFSKISRRFMFQTVNKNTGYAYTTLCNLKKNIRQTKTVHRIVAEAWLPKSMKECINHKNENKLDNHASNLEWCTKAYNNKYNGKDQRCCKPVEMYDLQTGKAIIRFSSARKAAEIGFTNYKNISAVCRGKRKSAYGKGWRFA